MVANVVLGEHGNRSAQRTAAFTVTR